MKKITREQALKISNKILKNAEKERKRHYRDPCYITLGLSQTETKKYMFDKVWEHFSEWMKGQTCPMSKNGKMRYWKHDVERYLEGILHGRPTYFD